MYGLFYMPETDKAFTKTITHLWEIIFCHYLQMHLMRMNLLFFLLNASRQVLSDLKYSDKIFFRNFYRKKWVNFALQHAAFEIGHT